MNTVANQGHLVPVRRVAMQLFFAVALCLMFFPAGTFLLAADQDVITSSGMNIPGSLRQAVSAVGSGDNVRFQPAVAGQTISLSSNLDVTRSMNFVNDSAGEVTVDLDGSRMNITDGSTISLDSGLTFQAASRCDCIAVYINSSCTINGLKSTIISQDQACRACAIYAVDSIDVIGGFSSVISVIGAEKVFGIQVGNDLNVTNGFTGKISVTGKQSDFDGGIAGLYTSHDLNITGGLSDAAITAINAEEYGVCSGSYGLYANNNLCITGGLAGTTITSKSDKNTYFFYDWTTCGLYASNDLNITGGLTDTTITSEMRITHINGECYTSRNYGLYAGNNLSITGGLAGTTIKLESCVTRRDGYIAHGRSCGLYAGNNLSITGGLTGIVSAIINDGRWITDSNNYGLYANNNLSITGGLTGVVSATIDVGGSGEDSNNYGLYANNNLSITGGLTGVVSATIGGSIGDSSNYGLYAKNNLSIIGDLSGNVTAIGSETFAMYAGENLNGGEPSTPLVITGNVSAEGSIQVKAIDGGQINLKLDHTGTLSAINSGGVAHAIFSHGAGNDTVELVAGCTVVGDIDLATATDDTLILSGTTGTTAYDGNIAGVENLNATGGVWTLNEGISGPTAITVSGGTLTLAGDNSYTGTTTISGGTLIVNGQIVGDTDITNGTLCGTGRVGNLTNNNVLAPGNSIGTMTVTGDYTHNADATLEIEITPAGASDLVDVSGTAHINGGTVEVLGESGWYTDERKYTFLDASGGVIGEFGEFTDNMPFFNTTLIYNPNNTQILVERIYFVSQAQTFNQRAVASYLDDHTKGASGDFLSVLTELDTLSGDAARAAFDAMSGEIYGGLSTVGIENTDRFLRTIASRLRSRSLNRGIFRSAAATKIRDDSTAIVRGQNTCQNRCGYASDCWAPWAAGYGVGAQIASDGNASGLDYSTGGVAFGLEEDLNSSILFGLVGGYSQTFVSLDDRADRGTVDSAQAGLYLHHDSGSGYATGIAAYGHNAYDMRRQVTIGTIARTARADYDGNEFSFYLETGRNYCGRIALLQPFGALQYIQLHQDGFNESGANSVNLSVGGIGADSFRGLLGTRLVGNLRTRRGRLLSLEGRALWRHEFLDEVRIVDASFIGQPGGAFVINGVNVDRDAAILGGGLTFCLNRNANLYANYDLLFSQNYTAHAGTGGLMLSW